MTSWFRAKPSVPVAPEPNNEERLQRLRQTREALRRRHATALRLVDECHREALRFGQAGQKQMAVAAIRRKQAHERELAQVAGLLTNVESQLSAIETATLSASVATSMRDGAKVMSSVHAELDTVGLERDMLDMRLHAREAEHATRSMTRPLFDTGYDEDDYDDELAKIMMGAAPPPPHPLQSASVAEETVVMVRRADDSAHTAGVSADEMKRLEADLGM